MKESIFDLLVQNRTLQDFADASSRLIGIPYWIMDESFGLIAVSHDPSAQVYRQQIFEKNGVFLKAVDWTKAGIGAQIRAGNRPIRRYDEDLGMPLVLYDITVEGQLAGRLTFFLTNDEELPDKYVTLIADACSVYLRNEHNSGDMNLREHFLQFLLDGKMTGKEIREAEETAGLAGSSPYRLITLDFAVGQHEQTSILHSWLNHMRRTCPQITSVVREGICVILETADAQVSSFLDTEGIRAGISMPFDDLQDVPAAMKQAMYALEKNTEGIRYFDDLYEEYFTETLQSLTGSPAFILPEVRRMRAYDEEYNTHYTETAVAYYECGGSKEKAARYLDIHLNSVKYRLQQIQKLFGLDIDRDRKKIQLALLLEKKK